MKRYHLNYFACGLSLVSALLCAMNHLLGLLVINFFFAVWNWYIAEYLREKDKQNEENNGDSGSNDGQDEE